MSRKPMPHRTIQLTLAFGLLGCLLFQAATAQSIPAATETAPSDQVTESLEGDFDTSDIVAATAWADSLHLADWLGPLAPVAMSPFFGIALLSGLALFGPEWITDNALLGSSGPLQNHALFWVFVGLAVLTSLPRLTKVSKPFAQAVDRLETYAVIVILLAIKVISSMESTPDETTQVAMIQLGIFSFTLDTLLAIAMVINVLVINSVKFFFEFLVWLTPIPFLDAVFEVGNKVTCAFLMAIYAYSPTIATLINLLILAIAAIALRWINRRVQFYRTMILDPVLAKLWTGFGTPKRPELIVFPRDSIGPFPAKSRLKLVRGEAGSGWELKQAAWWLPATTHLLPESSRLTLRRGWVMHTIDLTPGQATGADQKMTDGNDARCSLTTSRRYHEHLDRLLETLSIVVPVDASPLPAAVMLRGLKDDFA